MKNKTKIEFLKFNSGTADIYDTDDDGEIIRNSGKRVFYGNKTIGVNRYFSARQNDIELKKVIHIHKDEKITTENVAVIDKTAYNIEQVQHYDDTMPKSTVISLSQRGLYEGEDDGVS